MIIENWNKADLRINSMELSSIEISRILNINPTESAEKGQLMSPRNPKSQKRDCSIWILNSGLPDLEPLENHLNILLSFIENKQKELNILKEKCDMDIFCGLSLKGKQGGFSLGLGIIKKLSFFPIAVTFDIYIEEE